MRFTFVHAADLHLDSPLRGAFRTEASGGDRLRATLEDATFRAFERIVDECLTRGAAFLVVAGDLFETRDRSVRARLRLRDQLRRLGDAGVRTFIVHGNHDPLSGDSGSLAMPEGVKVFGSEWQEVPVVLDGRVACRIQGISYPSERVEENLALRFARRGPEFTLGVLHANVGHHGGHANYAPASWDDLSGVGLDYWALGHVHTRTERPLPSGGLAVYPGNPQGRHALEPGPRGCVVVEVEAGHARTEFVAVDSVRWQTVPVDVTSIGEIGVLESEIEAVVAEACDPGRDAHAVRVVLEGRGPLHAELSRAEDREAIEARLREALARRPCPVVLEGLIDETEAALDLEGLRAEGGLYGALLAQAESIGADPLFRENGLRQLDDALRRLGLPPTRAQAELLLARSTRRALELLAGGDE